MSTRKNWPYYVIVGFIIFWLFLTPMGERFGTRLIIRQEELWRVGVFALFAIVAMVSFILLARWQVERQWKRVEEKDVPRWQRIMQKRIKTKTNEPEK